MKPQNKTKVLFITRAWGGGAGGMERLSAEMLKMINSSSKIDANILKPAVTAGNSLFVIRLRSAFFAISIIPKALSSSRHADIVHIGDPVLSLAGWLIQTFIKVPVVSNVHGLDIVYPNKLYQLYLNFFFDKLHAYLPISKHVKNILDKRNITGKVRILNPGINDHYYDSSVTKAELESILGFQTNNKCLLFTSGRLVKRKGHAWFIKNVMTELPDNFVYIIAGSGSEKENISKEIEENNLAERVIMLGRVTDEQLKILYNTIDIFVQPNVKVPGDMEGFGLVLLEAALSNRLVLTHGIEGMTDAIHDNKNGILIDYQDTESWINNLLRYSADKDSFKDVLSNARQYTLDNFSWSNLKDQYEQTFLDFSQK